MAEEQNFLFTGAPERLDRFLARRLAPLSRTRVQQLIRESRVTVNGASAVSGRVLKSGDRIRVALPEFSNLPHSAADTVPVLYEDEHIIVVNKPAGLVVHPAGPHRQDTLIQRLWPKLAPAWSAPGDRLKILAAARPGVVHRLDRGTSGVMVLAKTPRAAEDLSRQFAERGVEKIYLALVQGVPSSPEGRILSTVGRSRRQPLRMSVADAGRPAETGFKVLERFPAAPGGPAALIEARPKTGRTHQIRVQLSALGHPLLGDVLYKAKPLPEIARPLLHALSLKLRHPATGREMRWEAPPPPDFQAALRLLRRKPSHMK